MHDKHMNVLSARVSKSRIHKITTHAFAAHMPELRKTAVVDFIHIVAWGLEMEIEKKYLVREMPDLSNAVKKEIEQGYLCKVPVIRIRKSNEDYILTYKSLSGRQDAAIQNQEVEVPLNKEAYGHLRGKVDGNLIKKTRYVLPLADGKKAELDVFGGSLEGLVFVEVEFESEGDAIHFTPPKWFGEDVSKDRSFSNAYISEVGNYGEWKKRRSTN